MEDNTGNTLESDWSDVTAETDVPAQPMVVIHYRNRGVPRWAIIPLIVIIPIAGILVYDRFFVEPDRANIAPTRRILNGPVVARPIIPSNSGAIEHPKLGASETPPVSSTSTTVVSQDPQPSPDLATAAQAKAVPSTEPNQLSSTPVVPANISKEDPSSRGSELAPGKSNSAVEAGTSPRSAIAGDPQPVAVRADGSPVPSTDSNPVEAMTKNGPTPAFVAAPADPSVNRPDAAKIQGPMPVDRPQSQVAQGRDDAGKPTVATKPTTDAQHVGRAREPLATDTSAAPLANDSGPLPEKTEAKSEIQEETTNKNWRRLTSRALKNGSNFDMNSKEALAAGSERGWAYDRPGVAAIWSRSRSRQVRPGPPGVVLHADECQGQDSIRSLARSP